MNELVAWQPRLFASRVQLLATASAFALLTVVTEVDAQEDARPTAWIELGGQVERMADGQDVYAPSFLDAFSRKGFSPVLPIQRPPRYSIGGEARLNFEPKGTDWRFSAGVRYGRTERKDDRSQKLPTQLIWTVKTRPGGTAFQQSQAVPYHFNTSASGTESHTIADFTAGKDVGIGFLSNVTSLFSGGIRFAQFTSGAKANLDGVPDLRHYKTHDYTKYGNGVTHHRYYGNLAVERSFRGVGPTISWDASRTISGSKEDGISLDWGLNAAVLFGRQKNQGAVDDRSDHYRTFIRLFPDARYVGISDSPSHHIPIDRVRNVTVPNVGGFAGVSMRYPGAKISFGYLVDAFFGAMDGGIETRKTYARDFYGPFTTISIGLGG